MQIVHDVSNASDNVNVITSVCTFDKNPKQLIVKIRMTAIVSMRIDVVDTAIAANSTSATRCIMWIF